MRTTTLALLSGAAMSISAATIYNATPAGGFRGEMNATLEPPALRAWPQLESATEAEAAAPAQPGGVPFAAALPTAAPTALPASSAFEEPASVAAVVQTAAPRADNPAPQFVNTAPPSTKRASSWRGVKAVKAPAPQVSAERSEPQQQRVAMMRQEPQPPPRMARPMSTSSFQSAPPASSFAAPMSTSSPRATSTSH